MLAWPGPWGEAAPTLPSSPALAGFAACGDCLFPVLGSPRGARLQRALGIQLGSSHRSGARTAPERTAHPLHRPRGSPVVSWLW